MDSAATLAVAVASVTVAVYLAAIAYAIVQIVRTRDLSDIEKGVWMITVVFAPLFGALVWYWAGPHPFGLRLTGRFDRSRL